jgi:hypothetical protein
VKVEGPKSTSQVGRAKAPSRPSSSSGEFAAELDRVTDSEDAAAPAVEGGSGMVGIGGILAAQSVDDRGSPQERRRRAQRGLELLDRLEEVRRGLLLGSIPKDRLADLVRLVRDRRERGTDPVIARLLDEIELRAAVELAKLGLPIG